MPESVKIGPFIFERVDQRGMGVSTEDEVLGYAAIVTDEEWQAFVEEAEKVWRYDELSR